MKILLALLFSNLVFFNANAEERNIYCSAKGKFYKPTQQLNVPAEMKSFSFKSKNSENQGCLRCYLDLLEKMAVQKTEVFKLDHNFEVLFWMIDPMTGAKVGLQTVGHSVLGWSDALPVKTLNSQDYYYDCNPEVADPFINQF